ncbi:MAG: hypothetical protein Q9175_004317 [Cornicularia normoerica]
MLPAYQATFSVPMHCDACIKDISSALSKLPGVRETDFSLPKQLLTTTSTTPLSAIISTIEDTGRTAILRGSGKANSAAVCILETPPPPTSPSVPQASPVRGLARLIELSDRITLLDMTLTGLPKGTYTASIRQSGDISNVPGSMGGVFTGLREDKAGDLGKLEVDGTGRGSLVGEVDWRVWEMVGRGVVVERLGEVKEGENGLVVGVVARSAGVWENEKVVCGCSGKTVWEEREEMVGKGML